MAENKVIKKGIKLMHTCYHDTTMIYKIFYNIKFHLPILFGNICSLVYYSKPLSIILLPTMFVPKVKIKPESVRPHTERSITTTSTLSNESSFLSKDEIEKLGRARPETLQSTLAEIFFCFSVLMSILMTVNTCDFFIISHKAGTSF